MTQLAGKLSCSDDQTNSNGSMNSGNCCSEPIKLATFLDYLRTILLSTVFLGLAKKNNVDFTRKRKLTFVDSFGLLINLVRTSAQTALDRFFPLFGDHSTSVSQQAFSKARQKIRWQSCQYLMKETVKQIYQYGTKTRHGFIVLAVDGSKIQLPSDPNLKQIFGTLGSNESASTAQSSVIFDVLNGFIIDANCQPLCVDERTLAIEHLNQLNQIGNKNKFLVLFDRGYPSFELIKHCVSNDITFLMRVKSKFNCEIDNLTLGCHNFTLAKNNEESIRVIVIKFKLPKSGEIETLITNLFD
jgi:hypothetical protein